MRTAVSTWNGAKALPWRFRLRESGQPGLWDSIIKCDIIGSDSASKWWSEGHHHSLAGCLGTWTLGMLLFATPGKSRAWSCGQWNQGFTCPPPLQSGCLLYCSWAPPESCMKSLHGETHVLLDSCSQRKTRIPPIVPHKKVETAQQRWQGLCEGWWQVDESYRDQPVKVLTLSCQIVNTQLC